MLKIAVAVAVAAIVLSPSASVFLYPAKPISCSAQSSIVVVTGVSSGLGKDAALHLASLGHTVVGTVRKPADASAFTAASPSDGQLVPVVCDVNNPAGVAALADKVQELRAGGKRLTGLVNNAGISRTHKFEDWLSGKAAEDAALVMETNVLSIFKVTGALLPALTADAAVCGSTRIVNVGSLAGFATRDIDSVYSGSKGAVERLSDGMRRLFTPKGIWTSVVEPGYVASVLCNRAQCKDQAKDTSTPAIAHALLDSRPRPRYLVASAGAFPAWLVAWLFAHLPDPLLDMLMQLQPGQIPR